MSLYLNIRFWILLSSFLGGIIIYFLKNDELLSLVRAYGFLALIYLYLALLVSPLVRLFPWFPYKSLYLKARRALGVSSAFFAGIHGNLVIFKIYSGPQNFFSVPIQEQWPLYLGLGSMWILIILACTSFDFIVEKLGFARWKFLHRLVYIAGVMVVIHGFTVGNHLKGFSHPLSWFFAMAIIFLLTLELIRFTTLFKGKNR